MSPGPSFSAPESQTQRALQTQSSSGSNVDRAAPRQRVAGLSLPEALILPLGCHVDSPATAGAERQVHQGCEHRWSWQRPRGSSAVGHRGPGPARKGEAGTRGEKGGRGLEGTTDACLSFWEGAEGRRG